MTEPVSNHQIANLIWELDGHSAQGIVRRMAFDLDKANAEVERLQKEYNGLAKAHEWSEHFDEGCICEWHKRWRRREND